MANVAKLPVHTTEDPWLKSRRLMAELSDLLDEMDPNIEYAMVCPASKADKTGRGFIAFGPYNDGESA